MDDGWMDTRRLTRGVWRTDDTEAGSRKSCRNQKPSLILLILISSCGSSWVSVALTVLPPGTVLIFCTSFLRINVTLSSRFSVGLIRFACVSRAFSPSPVLCVRLLCSETGWLLVEMKAWQLSDETEMAWCFVPQQTGAASHGQTAPCPSSHSGRDDDPDDKFWNEGRMRMGEGFYTKHMCWNKWGKGQTLKVLAGKQRKGENQRSHNSRRTHRPSWRPLKSDDGETYLCRRVQIHVRLPTGENKQHKNTSICFTNCPRGIIKY